MRALRCKRDASTIRLVTKRNGNRQHFSSFAALRRASASNFENRVGPRIFCARFRNPNTFNTSGRQRSDYQLTFFDRAVLSSRFSSEFISPALPSKSALVPRNEDRRRSQKTFAPIHRRATASSLGAQEEAEPTMSSNSWKRTQTRLRHPEQLEKRAMMSAQGLGILGPEPINGVGNNVANPTLGAANTDFSRLGLANFADGISAPNGPTLPSARVISNLIANQDLNGTEADDNNARSMSDFVYAWGQFIDHDIDLTESGSVAINIPVPAGDATFDPTDEGDLSIAFDRSQIAAGTGASTSNPAQFVNQITSYIDGSMIYGSNAATAAALRTFSDGQLKTSAGERRRNGCNKNPLSSIKTKLA
jgi:hypothetical protein